MRTLSIVFIFLFFLQSCTNKDNVTPDQTQQTANVVGSWKISSYVDNKSRDRTARYTAYTFDFLDNNNFQVKQGTTIVKSGTWANGSSYWAPTVVILIKEVLPEDDLGELNDDWRISEKTDKTLKVSNGGGKVLIFGK